MPTASRTPSNHQLVHLGFDLHRSNGNRRGINGGLELGPDSTFSNSQMLSRLCGAILAIDGRGRFYRHGQSAGVVTVLRSRVDARLVGHDAGRHPALEHHQLDYADFGLVQKIDLFETPYTGDHYSLLKVDGVLRLCR